MLEKTDNHLFFEQMCTALQLGTLKGKAKRVSGGYMHKMFHIKTDSGNYAVKLLNPAIMQRENVFENYNRAEALEKKLQEAGIPVVPALQFQNTKMQCMDGQYFYVFNWTEGKALTPKQIKEKHCTIMGEILAKMHLIECRKGEGKQNKELMVDWDAYIAQAQHVNLELAALLSDNRELLYRCQQMGNDAVSKIPNVTCISNGDMDVKNVLWLKDSPQIIDLECLCYGNPFTELFQLALCWSGLEQHRINYNLLKAFIQSYVQTFGAIPVDWEVLYSSDTGRLEWLAYNVKRALGIECTDEAEGKLGMEQVKATMQHILYYEEIREPLLTYLHQSVDC